MALNGIKTTLGSVSLVRYMLTYLIVFNITLFFASILTSNWFTEVPNIKNGVKQRQLIIFVEREILQLLRELKTGEPLNLHYMK